MSFVNGDAVSYTTPWMFEYNIMEWTWSDLNFIFHQKSLPLFVRYDLSSGKT